MKAALFAAVLVLAASPALADVNVAGNDQQITVECGKHKNVNVTGNRAVITLAGPCELIRLAGNKATVKGSVARVIISGNDNNLVLDAVDEIVVSGNKNTALFKRGVKAKQPKVLDSGNDNHVGQSK